MYFITTTVETRPAFPATERLNIVQFTLSGSPKYAALLREVWEICRGKQWRAHEQAK
jgi:hypothetical protein